MRKVRCLWPIGLMLLLAGILIQLDFQPLSHLIPGTVFAQMPIRPPKIAPVAINFSTSGNNTVIAGIAGQSICVFGIQYVASNATNLTFQDTGSGIFSGPESMLANGSNTLALRELSQIPYYVTGLGNGFVINSSIAVQVGGSVWYAPCL
jgi:hypothetical protein